MSVTRAGVDAWVGAFAAVIASERQALVRLDTAIGDGDHGTNLDRGASKAVEKLATTEGDDVGAALKAVGMALVSSVGGAGGPLYGTLFLQMGNVAQGREALDLAGWTEALEAGVEGVRKRGKAQPGDKTMLDALLPAVEALKAAPEASLAEALAASAEAAREGMEATTPLVARKGRASYLGERSAGHQDPGATSSYLLLKTAAEVLGKEETNG